jgi:hypothetical protein
MTSTWATTEKSTAKKARPRMSRFTFEQGVALDTAIATLKKAAEAFLEPPNPDMNDEHVSRSLAERCEFAAKLLDAAFSQKG